MSDHKHGDMNIEVQQKTFDGFVNYMTKGTIVVIVALIVMAILGA